MRRYNRQKLPSLLLLAFGRIIKNWANYYKMKLMSKLGRNFVPEVQQSRTSRLTVKSFRNTYHIKTKTTNQWGSAGSLSRPGSVQSWIPNFKIKIVTVSVKSNPGQTSNFTSTSSPGIFLGTSTFNGKTLGTSLTSHVFWRWTSGSFNLALDALQSKAFYFWLQF